MQNAYKLLLQITEWKRPRDKRAYAWKDDIEKMYICGKIGCETLDRIQLAYDELQ